MTDNSTRPPPSGPESPHLADTRPGPQQRRAWLAVLVILAGGAVAGLAAGLVWAVVAPRVKYQMYTLKPPTAYATNPETSAFIAADGWYCVIALAGGALLGLLAYLFAIRRHGALPMAGVVLGSIAAAFIAAWLGHLASGGPGFNHLLAISKPGTYLYAPISLGSPGALAFWPFAAAAVPGGIELVGVMRARHRSPAGEATMPGMDSFIARTYSASQPYSGQPGASHPDAGQPHAGQSGASQPDAGQPHAGQPDARQSGASQPDAGHPDAGQQSAGDQAWRPDYGVPGPG